MESDFYCPHPLTHFIIKYYTNNSGSINNERAAANNIVPFLNFVLEKVEENDPKFKNIFGICDLTNEHVNEFLTHCVQDKENSLDTLKRKEMYLSKFYKYLDDEGVLKTKPKYNIVTSVRDTYISKSYYLDLMYKKTDMSLLRKSIKKKDLVTQVDGLVSNNVIRLKNIRELLNLAKLVTPDIAFGVALQIFAGLRRGETVNLLTTSIKSQGGYQYGQNGMIIKVRDRKDILFTRLNTTYNEEVKNPRDQACLIDKILCEMYRFHVETILPKHKETKTNALFIDSKGNPMSGDTYDKRFLKLKETYLAKLLVTSGRKNDYDDFAETRWRSHIGRGIFTNMCRDCGFSAQETAIIRGDRTTEAMHSYFDILSATKNISKALECIVPKI